MFDWKGKKLLVLGATSLMGEIVREAQRRGAYVVVVDYYEDSPAKKFADEALLMNATDVDALAEYVRENKIDGVLTGFADSLLPAYMQLCRKTGLPCYLDEEQLKFTTDKAFFKELCRMFDIPVIREYSMDETPEFPVLVKPVDNSGARGIYICRKAEDFQADKEKALSFSKSGNILIEDYLTYDEATAFYLFIDGKAHLAAMADRHICDVKDGFIRLPSGYTYPSSGLDKFLTDSHPKFVALFEKLGIRNGMMFLQGFLDEDRNFIPYESGYRLTGSLEYHLLEAICGYNSLAMLINFALTGKMCEQDISGRIDPRFSEKAYNISCLMKPGKIAAIRGREQISALKDVCDTFYSYEEGYELPPESWGRLAQIFLRIQVTGGEAGYNRVVDALKKHLSVSGESGEELLITREIVKSR